MGEDTEKRIARLNQAIQNAKAAEARQTAKDNAQTRAGDDTARETAEKWTSDRKLIEKVIALGFGA